MPAEKNKVTHTFQEGINTSTAEEFLSNSQARYILNCNSLSTASGDVGIITNVKGNLIVPNILPSGTNKTIGYAVDEESNNLYFFNWNSNKFHGIYRYNALDRTILPVLLNLTDTNSVDILRFDPKYRILHADVVRNEILYWVDGINPARKTNIRKCMDKSTAGYGSFVREEYISAYKIAPLNAPVVSYINDDKTPINRLYGNLYKFVSRFIYFDGEKSNWSDISNVPLPKGEPITGISAIPTVNNGISISIETGSPDVKMIEIAMQSTDSTLSSISTTLNYVTIANLDKSFLNIASDSNYVYYFYNNGTYLVTDVEKILRPYSYLPRKPLCQSFIKNAIVYANFNEGFETVKIDVEASVTYNDKFVDDSTETQFNEPQFNVTNDDSDYVGAYTQTIYYDGTSIPLFPAQAPSRFTRHTVTVGVDVKEGNEFKLKMTNGATVDTFDISVKATLTDTSLTIVNKLKQKLIDTGRIYKDTDEMAEANIYDTVNSSGDISFSFIMKASKNNGNIAGFASVEPVRYSTLKDTGQSDSVIKLGSAVNYGIMYEDFDGRKSLVYSSPNLIIRFKSLNELILNDGKTMYQAPTVSLSIKHRPPIWAKSWQVVRSGDLVYGNYIQMLIQNVINLNDDDAQDYIDLAVGSLFTYQKIHPNTPLIYQFTKGDRIRLIKKTSDDTYYPFIETEIISYQDSVTENIRENITINGSATATVEVSSDKNIGKYIIVDGIERQIVSAPTATTYLLNNTIGDEEKTFFHYDIVDRRGTVRIRKPTDVTIEDNSIVEIFSPSNLKTQDSTQYFEFQQKFAIINPGTIFAYHAGSLQNQTEEQDAIVEISKGTAYIRNRELPINNAFPGTQLIIDSVEDQSYSDFYPSKVNDNGRVNVEDTGDGEVHFGSRMRFSNNFIEDTRINGLNDFDNLDRADYNDQFGDIVRTYFDKNRIYTFKRLRDTWVPVGQSILSQADGTPVVGLSNKLLGDMQYFSYEGGIGNNPESLAVNSNWLYHVMPNAGVVVRIGGDGITPISELYEVDNELRRQIKNAVKNGIDIIGGFDGNNGVYVPSISDYREKSFDDSFIEGMWTLADTELANTTTFEIVDPALNGSISFENGYQITYTPDPTYTGSDAIVYRAIVGGNPTMNKNLCIEVTELIQEKSWRAKASSAYCITEEGANTGNKAWTTLEEYKIYTGELTGEEKPNDPSSGDYVPPIIDETACPTTFPYRWEADEETAYCESNTVVIDDFDYLVARYFWLPGAGTDLDTATGFVDTGVVGVDENWVGYSNGYTVPGNASGAPGTIDPTQYLQHAGDNTGTGAECVLIRFPLFSTENPSATSPIKVEMYAIWWGSRLQGDAKFELIAYKGGTMVKNGFEFENDTPGTEVFRQTFTKNVTQTDHDALTAANVRTMATKLGTIDYDIATSTAVLTQA